MLSTKLKEAAGNSADATLYVDDVFSTYLYTGNGSTQTINNGIDLAGKGGMVWQKSRSDATAHVLSDTLQGVGLFLESDSTGATSSNLNSITAFNSSGFAFGSLAKSNTNLSTYVSWTFRKADKFFDVVTWSGNSTAGRQIPHSLGVAPGMIIVKQLNGVQPWAVYHRGITPSPETKYLLLNTTDTTGSSAVFWNNTAPTSTDITLGLGDVVNGTGYNYVAYLFAHNTSTDGLIQCGSFTTDGSGNTTVNLGWEPQWVLTKATSGLYGTTDWVIADTMRGTPAPPQNDGVRALFPNSSVAEDTNYNRSVHPTATGFVAIQYNSTPYIYMAIRMPNKPPTSGTQVFSPVTATAANNLSVTAGFPVDLAFVENRVDGINRNVNDRLRGGTTTSIYPFDSSSTASETSLTYIGKGISFNSNSTGIIDNFTNFNQGASSMVYWMFKRAPGFFDEVCYTGTGVATTQAHNLGAVPELMIVKSRSAARQWFVYVSSLGNQSILTLQTSDAAGASANAWNATSPTSSVFTIGTNTNTNESAQTFVAYLFATLAGISKVGSYTGNGSTGQAIACGFSAGARFVLIKRTDSTGDWYTFDSARGLTSGSSPYLLLNSTAAEVTGNNGVYASTGGFTLGSTASTTTNINAATYIFLAVA